ncbi:MAG: hypothetical protein QG576_216 [Bacteroidota bacterium]|nr:hypothetical protein [Bacteroidota bacterium]
MKFLLLKEQKYQLLIFLTLYLVMFLILTWLYPYPASISDSGSYVMAAFNNSPDTYRPFGYSRFLISVHKWSPSIHFLVFIQYFLNAVSTLFLVFTVKYFFRTRNNLIYYLYAFFAIISPLILYLANSVLSDSLFTSLTLIWIGCGLWMIYSRKDQTRYLFYLIHLLSLFYLINVRYTGLAYLVVTLLIVLISFYRRNIYICAILLIVPLLMVYGFYRNQKAKIYDLVHVNTFSGFSGWQLANNALNCVPYLKLNPADVRDKKVREFTKYVMEYDTLLIMRDKPSAKYMWDNKLPLKSYCFYEAGRTNSPYIYQWNYLGEYVYSKFGSYIIKKYPFSFASHYLFPNLRLVLLPTQDQVVKAFIPGRIPDNLLKEWFRFNDREKIYSRSRIYEKGFTLIPVSRLIIWIFVFAALLILIMKRKQISWQPHQKSAFSLFLVFITVYSAFSIYAGPFELRYIAPVHMSQISLIYIILNDTGITFGKTSSSMDSES